MVIERLWRKRKTNGIGWDFENQPDYKISSIFVNMKCVKMNTINKKQIENKLNSSKSEYRMMIITMMRQNSRSRERRMIRCIRIKSWF